MMRICLLLFFMTLLCGCGPQPEKTAGQTISVPPETSSEVTVPSQTLQKTTEPSTAVPLDAVESLLEHMTAEELVGQLFLARCPAENEVPDLQNYHLGGYILFARDFQGETPESMAEKLESYQNASEIPLLIAVDEEGGTVCRVSRYSAFRSARFPAPRDAYEQGGMELVLEAEEEKARLLDSLGINVNMAPVCDIATDPEAFMYSRSLGQSPEITGQFAAETVRIMQQYRVGSVLKHFPGYGNNSDTHTGIAVDDRPLESLEETDLVPFQAGIQAGCGAILVSHTFVNCLDTEYPASLSPAVHDYLRQTMGFEGVIVTDDLAMQAITDLYGSGEAAVLAVLAGNDLLCATDYPVQYAAVLEAVQSGRISEVQLREAAGRVLRWKAHLGLLE